MIIGELRSLYAKIITKYFFTHLFRKEVQSDLSQTSVSSNLAETEFPETGSTEQVETASAVASAV